MGGTALMDVFLLLKLLHILGAAVLFGTGMGIAFFMLMAHRGGDIAVIAGTARIVVIADFLFTATAAVLQPLTGFALAHFAGYDLSEGWIAASMGLYVFIGLFWMPVVWLQIEIRNMATSAAEMKTALPPRYFRFMRIWFWCGWPAFISIVAIFYLMLNKPEF